MSASVGRAGEGGRMHRGAGIARERHQGQGQQAGTAEAGREPREQKVCGRERHGETWRSAQGVPA
eukprot:6995888-Alexandrium_andersonii.AAC.1